MGCGASSVEQSPIFAEPMMAGMMQGNMRSMMNGLMKVTVHNNDCTYQEVQDFMTPSSVNKPFLDKPGTFDPKMEGRVKESMMGGMMVMHRKKMVEAGPPHNKGITWEKFCEHRGYAAPGYKSKAPQVGEIAPDAKILSIDGGAPSTLLTEAKKLAAAKGSKKVILSFDAVTCPFYRAYAAQDMYKAAGGCPALHVYLREAEPCDVFDAGGMHVTSPLRLNKLVPWHKTEADRADIAKRTQRFLEEFHGKGEAPMWMDTMDDNIEATYEARPWRQYIIEAASGKIIAVLGLAPFNMDGKLAVIKSACAGWKK